MNSKKFNSTHSNNINIFNLIICKNPDNKSSYSLKFSDIEIPDILYTNFNVNLYLTIIGRRNEN